MKKVNLIIAAVFAISLIATPSFAASVASGTPVDFGVTATVPAASSVSITATKRLGSNDSEVATGITSLDFNNSENKLNYDSDNGIWVSDYYFVIDVGLGGGAGNLTVTTVYSEGAGAMPSGQTKGLGYKSTGDFKKVVGPLGSQTESALSPGIKLLENLKGAGQSVGSSELTGGFFRLYIGLYDGSDDSTGGLNDLGGEPFTNDDEPGSYTGTITITGTIT